MHKPVSEGTTPLSLSAEAQIDGICDRFEAQWKAGGRPRIEDCLGQVPQVVRPALLGELVRVELEYRRRLGERPAEQEFRERFPEDGPLLAGLFANRPAAPSLAEAETQDPAGGQGTRLDVGDNIPIPSVPGYEVLGVLGRGAMGVVYKARQARLGRVVALKMILGGGHADPTQRQRFQSEAEAIARLQHPNIVQVFEVGEHDGLPFFSMEFCPEGSLADRLEGAPLDPRRAGTLVATLARAVQAAHEVRVVHRDLKPGNVLLGSGGTPKVSDFGLAKRLDEGGGQTADGAIIGTPSYMAPEQAGGKTSAVGPAADVYALGAILYELLTGRPPFKPANTLDTIMQVVADEPVPPTQLQSKTPRDLETICLKCLHKEPAKRYTSAAELADDLGRYLAGEPIQARPVGRLERAGKWVRRNPAVAALTAGVAAALVLGACVAMVFAMRANEKAEEAVREAARADREAREARGAGQSDRGSGAGRSGGKGSETAGRRGEEAT
jgi:serine/threonine-protein kinase